MAQFYRSQTQLSYINTQSNIASHQWLFYPLPLFQRPRRHGGWMTPQNFSFDLFISQYSGLGGQTHDFETFPAAVALGDNDLTVVRGSVVVVVPRAVQGFPLALEGSQNRGQEAGHCILSVDYRGLSRVHEKSIFFVMAWHL